MKLDEALTRHGGIGPGFHFLRHALALIILAHHCRVAVVGPSIIQAHARQALGGAAAASGAGHLAMGQIVVELLRPGLFALVAMFFALSGFLVTGSALRSKSLKTFFANRALRIFPALSVEVTLSALVLGPIVTIVPLASYFTDLKFWQYFGNIVGHVALFLPGVFCSNPWACLVNANLWTLPSEFWCYIFMLAMMATGFLSRRKFVTVAIGIAVVVIFIGNIIWPAYFSVRNDETRFTAWYIVMMFMFGSMAFLNARHIPLNKALFVFCCIAYYGTSFVPVLVPMSGIFLTYSTIYLGMTPFTWFDRLMKRDLSYGTYLYGFPITQALVFFLLPHLARFGPYVRVGIVLPMAIGLTMLFATLSWIYIEKPALKLRKHFIREPAPDKKPIVA
jgi:peptidoglycan/LPS O-acetylase OafA/YrhL